MTLGCGFGVITEVIAFLGNPSFPYNAAQLDEFRAEIQRRDQEILAMSAKMKTLEEQHQDYQRHISVLKESLCAKEEHYNMLQADVSAEYCDLYCAVDAWLFDQNIPWIFNTPFTRVCFRHYPEPFGSNPCLFSF